MTEYLVLLAQVVTESGAVNWGEFLNLGILGVIFLLIVFKKLAPAWVVKDLEDGKQKLEEENHAFKTAMLEQVIPALTRATDALKNITEKGDR